MDAIIGAAGAVAGALMGAFVTVALTGRQARAERHAAELSQIREELATTTARLDDLNDRINAERRHK